MAAEANLGRFDLSGILVWDLMHLNTNGFVVRPNGGGIQGLVDGDSILHHPLEAVRGVDKDITLEETLETFVATQHLEVGSTPWRGPGTCVSSPVRTMVYSACIGSNAAS